MTLNPTAMPTTSLPTSKDLPMTQTRWTRRLILAAALGGGLLQTACVPLIVGGAAVSGALVATDRRTSGTQLEDQGIELKTSNRIREQLGDRVHISVNSYNRMVLLTGETRNDEDKAAVERIAQGVENVSSVLNEVGVGMLSSLSSRANDVAIAARSASLMISIARTTFWTPRTPRAISVARLASRSVTRPMR